MQLHDIAWSSIKRRRGRFSFLLVVVALAIGTVVALVSLSSAMRAEVSDELDRFGANIIITPNTRAVELAYAGVALGGLTVDATRLSVDDAAKVRTIRNRRNISAVAPKLIGTLEVDGERTLVIGAVFPEERRIKGWWHVDGRFAESPGEVMLGPEAAERLGKRAGDWLNVAGRTLRVVGVLAANGTIDDQAVFVDLALVQRVLGQPGAASLIEVSALCRGCPIDDIVAQIAALLPHARVAPIRQAVAARERAVRQFTRFAYVIGALVLLVGMLVVTTTMMAAVAERTQEIGILRAVGFRRAHVARIVLMESLAAASAGGLGGWLVGTLGARLAGPALAQLGTSVPVNPRLAVAAVAAAAILGASGGAYPALRAARMDPSQALRHL